MDHFPLAVSTIMLRNYLPFSFYKPNFGETLTNPFAVPLSEVNLKPKKKAKFSLPKKLRESKNYRTIRFMD
jgi:hypothetical protein